MYYGGVALSLSLSTSWACDHTSRGIFFKSESCYVIQLTAKELSITTCHWYRKIGAEEHSSLSKRQVYCVTQDCHMFRHDAMPHNAHINRIL